MKGINDSECDYVAAGTARRGSFCVVLVAKVLVGASCAERRRGAGPASPPLAAEPLSV